MFDESFIKDTRKDVYLLKILRIIAILTTVVLALQSSFSVFILKPRQEYSYYVLTVILFAVILLCSILYKSTFKLFRNLDILVPLGLYLFVDKLIGFLILSSTSFSFLNQNGFDFSFFFQNVSVLSVITLVWILQIVSGVVFVGWTTSAILQLRSRKQVDLLEALYEFKKWFFKVFFVLAIFKYIPIILMIPLIWSGITQSTILGFISASVIFSIVYNLATYAVVLFVLVEKDSLINSINKGVRGSLENISKVAVPIVLQLLILGFVYLVSVNYTVEKIENIEGTEESVNSGFGSEENKTITISNTTNTTTDEISQVSYGAHTFWVGSYNETTKWHEQTLSAVKAEPLKSVDFKLKILLLLLSIVMQIEVVRKIFGESDNRKCIKIGDRLFESTTVEQILEKERLKITPTQFVLIFSLFIYFLPFEGIFTKNTTNETVIENKSTSTVKEESISDDFREFDYPKVFLGEDFFEKKEIFLNPRFVDGKRLLADRASFGGVPVQLKTNNKREEKIKNEPKTEPDGEKYGRIIDIYAGSFDKEPGKELLVAGDKGAL